MPVARLVPGTGPEAVVSLPAPLHLAALQPHGAAPADVRRLRRRPPRQHRAAARCARRAAGTSPGSSPARSIFFGWALADPAAASTRGGSCSSAFIGVSLVLSLVMVVVFQLAHCVEEAASPSADELRAHRQVWAIHQVETHRRLLPPQSRPDLVPGRAQLPDRAPPLPAHAAHALPADRAHRAQEGRRARRALHRAGVAPGRAPLARAAPAQHGRAGPAGRDRDGLVRRV